MQVKKISLYNSDGDYAKRNLSANKSLLNKIKKRTIKWLDGLGLQLPVPSNQSGSLYGNNLSQNNDKVKLSTKYSMHESTNNTQELDNSSFSLRKDNKGNKIGKSVMEIWKPVENARLVEEFSNYLLHKHNIARWQQGKPVFADEVTSDMSPKL